MADSFWNRQQHLLPSAGMLKRPRTDYDMPPSAGLPSGCEMHDYIEQDDDRAGPWALKDTGTIGSAYDRYLQSAQLSSFTTGEASAHRGVGLVRAVGGGMHAHTMTDLSLMVLMGSGGPDLLPNGRIINFGCHLQVDAVARPGPETVPLPPDASSTYYVEGLPPDSSKGKWLNIFRPFVGYREVRLVSKESKHLSGLWIRGGDPLILCFVDFASPACAATALSALQGYKMDELNPECNYLGLQFSRYPGPRSGPGSRGKR